jgi:hypothetical protein
VAAHDLKIKFLFSMIINKAQGHTLNLGGIYITWPAVFHMASCMWHFLCLLLTSHFFIIHGCPQRVGNDRLISETLYIEKRFKVCNI